MAWEPHINSSFQVGIVVLCAVLAPIAPVLVGLRLWSKSILRSRLKGGDYLIIFSCVCIEERSSFLEPRELTEGR